MFQGELFLYFDVTVIFKLKSKLKIYSDEADKKEEYTVGLLNTLKHQNKISELVLLLENALLEFPENIEVKAKAIEVFYENLNQINSSNKSWVRFYLKIPIKTSGLT